MYGDLTGGQGREIYFRARRHQARRLSTRSSAVVRLGREEAKLADFSLNGVAFYLGVASELPPINSVGRIDIIVASKRVFSGEAEVVRLEKGPRGTKVAMRLLDAVLEPNATIAIAREAEFGEALEQGVAGFRSVPMVYREAVHEAALVLSHWRGVLEVRERELQEVARTQFASSVDELVQRAIPHVRKDWQKAHGIANEVIAAIPTTGPVRDSARAFTKTLLIPFLTGSPSWWQAYAKPRGYPGDFEFMNMIYDESSLGSSAFLRIMHHLGCEERLASTVRARKQYLVAKLERAFHAVLQRENRTARVASIGAGPAREVEEFIRDFRGDRGSLDVSLIDQDEGALEFANERIRRASMRSSLQVSLRCRHVSFKDLLASEILVEEVRAQDMVYTAGLFDYLPDRVASVLISQLVGLLAPGGRLLIGNAVDSPGVRWVPEFVLDWHMIYRSPAQMRALASNLQESCRIDVEFDESGVWQFLVIELVEE